MKLPIKAEDLSKYLKSPKLKLEPLGRAMRGLRYEDCIVAAVLLSADPSAQSLKVGLVTSLPALLLLAAVKAFPPDPSKLKIAGPLRFTRHPEQLAFWLLTIGLSLAARSFLGLALSVLIQPLSVWLTDLGNKRKRTHQGLGSFRYATYVPNFIPLAWPFTSDMKASPSGASWRSALSGLGLECRGRLGLIIFAWAALFLVKLNVLRPIDLLLASGACVLVIAYRIKKYQRKQLPIS